MAWGVSVRMLFCVLSGWDGPAVPAQRRQYLRDGARGQAPCSPERRCGDTPDIGRRQPAGLFLNQRRPWKARPMSLHKPLRHPGIAAALGAALLFGAGTPLAKWLLDAVSPWLLAGLLYLGSGLGLTLYRALRRAPAVRLATAMRGAPHRCRPQQRPPAWPPATTR